MLSLGRGLPDRQSFGAGVHSTQESLNACMGSCGIKVLLVCFPASRGQMCVFGRSLGVVVWVFRRASELRTSHLDIE